MTVSMLTTRLSSVITGWGGKETTCSRRSISGLTRSTISTTTATTMSAIRPAMVYLLVGHEGGGSLDLEYVDAGALREHGVLVVGAGAPHLAADLHLAAVRVHSLEHHGARSDERGGAGPHPG